MSSPARTYSFGGRTFTQGQVSAIRARNLARSPTPSSSLIPRAQPLTPQEAQVIAAQHTPFVDDPTHTATDPAVVQKLRQQFSGPGVAGYNFLKDTVGPNLAAYVPGTTPPIGFHPTPLKAAGNALTLLPWERGLGAVVPAVKAFRQHGGLDAAAGAYQAAFAGHSPLTRAEGWLAQKRNASRTAGLASPSRTARIATRLAMPIPVPAAAQRLRYGVPNRTTRQLELAADRALLFSGAAGTLENQAQQAAMYPVNKELDLLRWERARAGKRSEQQRYRKLAPAQAQRAP